MKPYATALISLLLSATSQAQTAVPQVPSRSTAGSIQITPSGSQQPSKAPAEHFIGSITIEPVFSPHDPSRASGGKVTFQPGASSAWHKHPLGQILIVTDGTGWIQQGEARLRRFERGMLSGFQRE